MRYSHTSSVHKMFALLHLTQYILSLKGVVNELCLFLLLAFDRYHTETYLLLIKLDMIK